MSYNIVQVALTELRELADSAVPSTLAYPCEHDALPPAFVAARCVEQREEGQSEFWCSLFYIVRVTDRMIVGSCGFKRPPRDGRVEIGFGISPQARNQGAATDAVAHLLRLAFLGGATQVMAEVMPQNLASTRVVQKLDFQKIGSRWDEENEFVVQWVIGRDS